MAKVIQRIVYGGGMAIFWGMGSKSKNYEGLWVPYFCSICDGFSSFAVTENYKYGQVYGIRIAKYKAKHFLVCQRCDRAMLLERPEQFSTAQAIGRRIAAENPSTINLMKYVADVARFVFSNTDLAEAVEKAEDARTNSKDESLEDVFPPAIESEPNSTLQDTKICPDCAETIKSAAKKCRFCNYSYE